MKKFVFVTGGVVSGIGKGITAASLGMLLKNQGFKISVQKLDPYINVDPGTMSPLQHGEVYVTYDGAETDLDLGHYERFIDIKLSAKSSHSAGKVYETVIQNERNGIYGGGTVQVIPHITNEIKKRIYELANDSEISIIEIGGTVGDIESLPFLEAIRQIINEVGSSNAVLIHTTYVPYLKAVKEAKTKPTQHSVNTLRSHGLNADFIVLRTEVELDAEIKSKIAMFANIDPKRIVIAQDASSIYKVPIILNNQNFAQNVCEKLALKSSTPDLNKLEKFISLKENAVEKVKIAIVGKYNNLEDAYFSINEALMISATHQNLKVDIEYIDAELVNDESASTIFGSIDGILVPGGFGERGTNGKIAAIKYARINKIPFLGICFGMQLATIEYARNVLGMEDANSTELNQSTKYPLFDLLEGRYHDQQLGGSMRLGELPVNLKSGTKIFDLYNQEVVFERHRHRYEFNNLFRDKFKDDFVISGLNQKDDLVETIELKDHDFFIGVQYHPELTARPLKPNPLFDGLIKASYAKNH